MSKGSKQAPVLEGTAKKTRAPLHGIPVYRVRGSYGSAQTTNNNRRHWTATDSLSADAANSADVRKILRERARYEVSNNSYAKGMVLTLANDVIGTGPRLQMSSGDPALDRKVEALWQLWADEINLAEKLRAMRMARTTDGEAFAIIATNPRLMHSIKVDIQDIESEQVANPYAHYDDNDLDGIVLDEWGNPASYRVLTHHPGSARYYGKDDHTIVFASNMLHVYRKDRPGQHRGVCEITPALHLFAQLRRYSLATLDAAETAANFAGLLITDAPANTSDPENSEVSTMDTFELERNSLLTMPPGYKMQQMEAKHPATTYDMFERKMITQIARCLNIPYNIAAGDSSSYNYASGRLDHQTYYKSIRVEQAQWAASILNKLFRHWITEFALLTGNMAIRSSIPDHSWMFDGFEHVDPVKEANAQTIRLENNTTTLAAECAKQGLDWEVVLEQKAKELKKMQALGLTPVAAPSEPVPTEEPEESDKEDY